MPTAQSHVTQISTKLVHQCCWH